MSVSGPNPYLAPESSEPLRSADPASLRAAPNLGRSPALFATIVALLTGACFSQAAALLAALLVPQASGPGAPRGLIGFWAVVNLAAVGAGTWGTYQALRRGVAAPLATLALLLLSSVLFRVGKTSFGWPIQFHIGFGLPGGLGLGVNLIGVGLAIWWQRLRRRDRLRALPASPVIPPTPTVPEA